MALPTLEKTWEIVPNQYFAEGLLPMVKQEWHQRAILQIVNTMLGFANNPWVMLASSDASTSGWPGPGWDAYTDIAWNYNGSAHSWIVLENAAGVQLCIDLASYASHDEEHMSVIISPSGGFGAAAGGTDGTNLTRPTALDQVTVLAGDWISGSTISNIINERLFHAWHSTDGKITRFIFWEQDVPFGIWRFEEIKNPRTGHTVPYAFGVYTQPVTTNALSISKQEDNRQLVSSIGTQGMSIYLMGMGRAGTNMMEQSAMIVAEEIDGDMAFAEIGLLCTSSGARGPKGKLIDHWWGQYQVVFDGDTYPDDPLAKEFIQCGALIFPWTGDATVMLTR